MGSFHDLERDVSPVEVPPASPVGEQFLPFELFTQSTQVKAVHEEAFLEIILMCLAVLATFWTQREEHFI